MKARYKKMLAAMQEKQKTATAPEAWFLYILQCKDGSLYTGITKNLDRRFKMHNAGKASRYTSSRRPVKMLYHEPCQSRTDALVRECAVKAFPRKKKEELIGCV